MYKEINLIKSKNKEIKVKKKYGIRINIACILT